MAALQRLAARHREGFRGTVVGITGSNGKTVVKEWIAQAVPPGDYLYPEDRSRMEEIKQTDPAAVVVNGYYSGYLGDVPYLFVKSSVALNLS